MSSGHDLDHVLSTYSWDQIGTMARCIARSRYGFVNRILGGAETGTRPAPSRAAKGPPARQDRPGHRTFRMADHATPEAKEAGLLAALRGLGKR